MSQVSAPLSSLMQWARGIRRAYSMALRTPAGAEVLIDLAAFCRANDTTFDPDPRKHAMMEGRRQVWLRIQEFMHLTPEQLVSLRTGRDVTALMENGEQQ